LVPIRGAAVAAHDHHVRNVRWGFALGDAALDLLGRVGARVRFTIITPSTSTRPSRGPRSSTRPVLPLSRPAITFTVSFFFESGSAPVRPASSS
jgi:hypothetical protein